MPTLVRHPEKKYINPAYSLSVIQKYMFADKTPLHWHEFYEIELFLSGKGKAVMNGTECTIERGRLFFMTPIDIHSYILTETTEAINISFTAKAIEDMAITEKLSTNNGAALTLSEEETEWIFLMAKKIRSEANENNFMSRKYISQMMGCLLIEILRKFDKKRDLKKPPDSIQSAIQYIYLHFREDLNLEIVAAQAGLSPNHFSEKFHQYMNSTFKEYLTRVRLDYAVKLLLYTEISVTEVSYFSGFNSVSYFLRAFKKKFNTSPLVYRKQNKKVVD